MGSPQTLAQVFVARLGGAASGLDLRSLDEAISAAVRAGKEAWPGLSLADEDFVLHLAARVGPDGAGSLGSLHAADLYLACACARLDPRALAGFDEQVLPAVARALRRWDPSFALVDEVEQILRQRLLVAQGGAAPKIATYSGRGPLTKWLRASAIRTAISLRRGGKKEVALEDEAIADWSTPVSDPELDFIKGRYRAEFGDAFRASLAGLTSQERNVLRLHLLDGLNIEQIGNLYGAHRATVARWIARSRETLLEQTKRHLGEKLSLGRAELESLMGLLRSQLDVSINRFLVKDRE
ncbi:MAG: sigma-70 family RNA polymerase sigma factor [Myxococcaceae bacterium]